LNIIIEDNGIGIEESKKQKTEHQKTKEGRGMKNTLERIALLNDLYKKNITCSIKDKENNSGVIVNLKINLT
jgi:sensor histidine kinase YesM